MTVQSKTTLKGYFNTGDTPTESNFADLVDTLMPTLIHNETLAADGTFDVSSISADYDMLEVILFARSDRAANTSDYALLYYNTDTTAANYVAIAHIAGATQSTSRLDAAIFGSVPAASSTAGYRGVVRGYIFDYASASRYTLLMASAANIKNATDLVREDVITQHEVAQTENRIRIQPNSGTNFVSGSRLIILGWKYA